MPRASNGSVELYYETAGAGEPVVFVEDIGYGAWLWGWQASAIAGPYETIVWDNRGTGRSDVVSGPYTVDDMAGDLEAILADHGVRSAHVVGAGMGGMIALQYALDFSRARSLTLMGTAAAGVEVDVRVQLGDPRESLEAVLSTGFVETHLDAVDRIAEWRRDEDASEPAADAQAAAVEAFDVRDRLFEITVPVLVMHGTADSVAPPEVGQRLANDLPRGRLEQFEDGSHLFFIEQARLATDVLVGFIEGLDDEKVS